MKVFPEWTKHFELQGASISGMDFALRAEPETYREAVRFIRGGPDAVGVLDQLNSASPVVNVTGLGKRGFITTKVHDAT